MSDYSSPHGQLVHAILNIDAARLGPLYEDSAEFHATVTVIARVLPALIGVLADDAARAAERRRLVVSDLMTYPSRAVWPLSGTVFDSETADVLLSPRPTFSMWANARSFPEEVQSFVKRAMEDKPHDTDLIRWRMGEVRHEMDPANDNQYVYITEWIPELIQ